MSAGSGTYVRRQTGSAANTRQLGLLIPGLGAVEIFSIICGEIASLARAQDYTVLWGDSAQPGQDENMSREHAVELCGQFIARRVAGVFFAPFDLADGKADVNHRIAERFSQAGSCHSGSAGILLSAPSAAFRTGLSVRPSVSG